MVNKSELLVTLAMVFCLMVLLIDNVIATKKTLKLVIAIHRHGDRCPVTTYPTDPYIDSEKYFPDGLGMLTSKGKQRMYKVGKYIRKRYNKFLTDSPREVYIRSSAKQRCLESVSLLMAGIYPPVGHWRWDSGLGKSWQPFPIQTVMLSEDGMLNPDSDCPTARQEVKNYLRSDAVRSFFRKHEKLVNFVEQKTRMTFDHHYVGRDLYNALEIQRDDFDLKLPDWVNETVYQGLRQFLDMSFIFDAATEPLRRLRAGLLIKDIRDRLKQSISEPKPSRKLIVYSTHDTQLSVFLTALKAYNMIAAPFGSTIFLELYHHSQPHNGFTLEMHYLNVTESEKTYRLPVLGCSAAMNETNCVDKFFNSVDNLIPNDWLKECKESGWTKKSNHTKSEL